MPLDQGPGSRGATSSACHLSFRVSGESLTCTQKHTSQKRGQDVEDAGRPSARLPGPRGPQPCGGRGVTWRSCRVGRQEARAPQEGRGRAGAAAPLPAPDAPSLSLGSLVPKKGAGVGGPLEHRPPWKGSGPFRVLDVSAAAGEPLSVAPLAGRQLRTHQMSAHGWGDSKHAVGEQADFKVVSRLPVTPA